MSDLRNIPTAQLDAQIVAAQRLLAIKVAHDKLLPFMRLTMPDPDDVDDPTKSMYEETPQARLLAEIMEKVDRGEMKRTAVSIGPQTGKSQIISRGAPAWMSGRSPRRHIMLGSYNQDFANEFGDEVRAITRASSFKQVFPRYGLRDGAQAKNLLITREGGKLAFVGVGGSGTGKPADVFIVDDPIRNDEDVQSDVFREKLWVWFNRIVFTRCHGGSAIVVVHTRWHEDDLIGRLCDPDHPDRKKRYAGISDKWTYINLPAVVDDPALARALGLKLEPPTNPDVISMFGVKPMSSIWPARKPLDFLAEAKRQDPRGFGALYMGKPTPDEGDYFKADWIVEYDRADLPTNLRKYGASDHAVSVKAGRDSTVIGCVGIDEDDDIWVLPELVWDQMETDKTVEELLNQIRFHKPMLWWLESELISKSFGPFLLKRMHEERVYVAIDPVTPSRDKKVRARSAQGRMSMRKIRFPRFAQWWPDARAQLLKFPFASHDDFVDWLAHICMGLTKEVAASPERIADKVIRIGTLAWTKAASERDKRNKAARKASAGW
jgi:predicted phage terminase large subunit-like protein